MRKNENKTYKFLSELLPQILINREVRINQHIISDGEVIRHFILVDFAFTLNSQLFYCEYDGTQHHRSVKKWGGKDALRKQKIRDKWLVDYCKSSNINLIVIDGRKIRGKKILTYLKRTLKPFLKTSKEIKATL